MRNNIHVGINAPANNSHLPDGLLVKANGLWQQAENLVAAQPAILRRVRLSRMSVDYAILERPGKKRPNRCRSTIVSWQWPGSDSRRFSRRCKPANSPG